MGVPGADRILDAPRSIGKSLIDDPERARVPLGATVRLHGRLGRADGRDLAALLRPSGEAELVEAPGPWWRAAAAVRQALRDSVAHRPDDQRALVPALVDGDDAEVDPGLQESFRVTGLTHLLAVSGTNLTLVVGFLLALSRWCRVRGRWLHLVAAEYVVPAPIWDPVHEPFDKPQLMGHLLQFIPGPNRYGPDAIYELHVWAWKANRSGPFADFNPDVSCIQWGPVP